jgi:hypothetical protein
MNTLDFLILLGLVAVVIAAAQLERWVARINQRRYWRKVRERLEEATR